MALTWAALLSNSRAQPVFVRRSATASAHFASPRRPKLPAKLFGITSSVRSCTVTASAARMAGARSTGPGSGSTTSIRCLLFRFAARAADEVGGGDLGRLQALVVEQHDVVPRRPTTTTS